MEISLEKVKYLHALANGAVTQEEVAHCRRNVRIGDVFRVRDVRRGSGTRKDVRPVIRKSRVTGKYKHLVTLDCGHSVTYVQIALYYRQNRNGRYIK
ncbi:hypothetical protein [Otoolea muris]|uniref:hypothetical protein n=1 Tax=Otoolea muris TaxID=2941515 RepID=UPI00203B1BB5|nr:hypothetical protein [Otoolea muris]